MIGLSITERVTHRRRTSMDVMKMLIMENSQLARGKVAKVYIGNLDPRVIERDLEDDGEAEKKFIIRVAKEYLHHGHMWAIALV